MACLSSNPGNPRALIYPRPRAVEWHQAARPLWVPRCGHAVVVAPYTRQGVGKKIEEVDVLFLFGGWNGEPLGDVWFTEAVDGNWNGKQKSV